MSSLLLTQVSIPERVSAEEFIEWMIAEPQTIVWLPTLHRLAVSETGTVWLILSAVKALVSGQCGEAVATGACCTCRNGPQSFSADSSILTGSVRPSESKMLGVIYKNKQKIQFFNKNWRL